MAQVFPFRALRYNPALVPLERVLTQPYDKISRAMQDKYYAADPHNLITVEKGRSNPSDTTENNVYTRAATALAGWIASGVLRQDPAPWFYAYSQEYAVPGAEERRIRRGFIGAGRLEEYSAGVVFRHEQTLSGPKADRLELLRHTETHTGQLFMLYSDPRRRVDEILAQAESSTPATELGDEYGVIHRLWTVSRSSDISEIHDFSWPAIRRHLEPWFAAEEFPFSNDADKAKQAKSFLSYLHSARSRRAVGVYPAADSQRRAFYLLTLRDGVNLAQLLPRVSPLQRELDVVLLHEGILEPALGITRQAVTAEAHLSYEREARAALDAVDSGRAQICFLLNPCEVEQVMKIATAGEVLPQKSTDFYPKLLSGITMHRVAAS